MEAPVLILWLTSFLIRRIPLQFYPESPRNMGPLRIKKIPVQPKEMEGPDTLCSGQLNLLNPGNFPISPPLFYVFSRSQLHLLCSIPLTEKIQKSKRYLE